MRTIEKAEEAIEAVVQESVAMLRRCPFSVILLQNLPTLILSDVVSVIIKDHVRITPLPHSLASANFAISAFSMIVGL
jgi:hypothetical protein